MNNTYIQDKLDAIENDLKEKGYTKFERETIIDITKQSFTDYHNHIVEKINKELFDEWEAVTEIDNPISINHMRKDFNDLLQDTNPKE